MTSNQLQSTTTQQTFPDNTQLVTVTYASGLQTVITTDTEGGSKQVDYPVPGNLNSKEVTNRDAAGNITDKTVVSAALDSNGVAIPNAYNTSTTSIAGDTNGIYTQVDRSFDAQGNLTSTATTIRATAGGELTTTVDSKVGGNDVSITYGYDVNKAPVVVHRQRKTAAVEMICTLVARHPEGPKQASRVGHCNLICTGGKGLVHQRWSAFRRGMTFIHIKPGLSGATHCCVRTSFRPCNKRGGRSNSAATRAAGGPGTASLQVNLTTRA